MFVPARFAKHEISAAVGFAEHNDMLGSLSMPSGRGKPGKGPLAFGVCKGNRPGQFSPVPLPQLPPDVHVWYVRFSEVTVLRALANESDYENWKSVYFVKIVVKCKGKIDKIDNFDFQKNEVFQGLLSLGFDLLFNPLVYQRARGLNSTRVTVALFWRTYWHITELISYWLPVGRYYCLDSLLKRLGNSQQRTAHHSA